MKKIQSSILQNATLLSLASFSLGVMATMGATQLTAYSIWDFQHGAAPSQHDIIRRYNDGAVKRVEQEQATTQKYNNRHMAAPAVVNESLLRNKSYRNTQIRKQQRLTKTLPDTSTRRGIYDYCSQILGLSGTRLTRCTVEWSENNIEYQLTQSHENK